VGLTVLLIPEGSDIQGACRGCDAGEDRQGNQDGCDRLHGNFSPVGSDADGTTPAVIGDRHDAAGGVMAALSRREPRALLLPLRWIRPKAEASLGSRYSSCHPFSD
jgi:hypothetical protein